jgi:hypothetical protein
MPTSLIFESLYTNASIFFVQIDCVQDLAEQSSLLAVCNLLNLPLVLVENRPVTRIKKKK